MESEKEEVTNKEVLKLIEILQKEEKEKAKERRQAQRMKRTSLIVGRSISGVPMKPVTNPAEIEKTIEKQKAEKATKIKVEQGRVKITMTDLENSNENNNSILKLNDSFKTASIIQKFSNLSVQPTYINQLVPHRKPLFTRKSKHCRRCERLLVKPDLSPTKIDFKRQHVALYVFFKKIIIINLLINK